MYRPAQVNNSLIWDQVLTPDVLFKRPSMHYWSSMQQTIDFHLLYNLIQHFFSWHGFVCLSESGRIYSLCCASDQFILCLAENICFIGRWVIKIHVLLASVFRWQYWLVTLDPQAGISDNVLKGAFTLQGWSTRPKYFIGCIEVCHTRYCSKIPHYSTEKCILKWKIDIEISREPKQKKNLKKYLHLSSLILHSLCNMSFDVRLLCW